MKKAPAKTWTWEQCEARGFHPWYGTFPRAGGYEQHCRSCGIGAVETMNRRKALADKRRADRQEEVRA